MNKLQKIALVATVALATLSSPAAFAEGEAAAAAESFQTFFSTGAAAIGAAMLTAAFVAVGWKWLKGMAFS